ncbi:helix-turn-helix transcriptional regulator [uncultured Maribacter sp.]|uniref:XRE family transcriptional regulator n=1 Tax=uncultured Maribacter sp. TaxID=431308 RepID=UPI0026334624|nr:helix-turn-helix transcriptional regulator [uncultured Maribacter sp.]
MRRKKNISQTDLAEAIGVSLRTIQLYEKREANIPRKNLDKIADFFNVSISELYATEVNEINIEYKKPIQKKSKEQAHKIIKLGPGKYLVQAPLIIAEKQIKYLEKLEDILFLKQMPLIGFILENVSVSNYAAFEITNNSMFSGDYNGLPNKTIVLGKGVSLKEFGKSFSTADYWVIVLGNSIMCKQITNYNKKENTITCHSLNISPEFPDFTLNLKDVKLLFRVIKKQVN